MVLRSPSSTPTTRMAGQLLGPLVLMLITTVACDPEVIKDLLKGQGGSAGPPGRVDGAVPPSNDGGSVPPSNDGGAVPPSKDGGGEPTNPCAATLCLTGNHCEAVEIPCAPGTKICPDQAVCVPNAPPPPVCPPVCKIACPKGNVLDANGCPTCACNPAPPPPSDPCATVKCAAGTHCQADVVMCIKAPCPPIASCVPDAPAGVFCGGIAGIACPGSGKCVDDPSDGCDPAKGGADCGGICSCVQNVACVKGATFDGLPKVCACVPGSVADGGVDSNGTLKEGESCGGFRPANSPTCGPDLFCQHQPGALCGAADAGGICVKVIASCPAGGPRAQPVCGCDGKSYASSCQATLAKVGILDLGACK